MSDCYILDEEKRPVKVGLYEWGKWIEKNDRHVAYTETELHRISTVFLGIDHSYGNGPPVLFETMVFEIGTDEDVETERYSSWSEADAGHAGIVGHWLKREADAAAVIKEEMNHDV